MNNVKQTFTITIPSKTGYMDLTEDVMECVRRSNIRNGIISISSMHTTASVFTATNDIEALNGYLKYYEKVSTLAEEPYPIRSRLPALMRAFATICLFSFL